MRWRKSRCSVRAVPYVFEADLFPTKRRDVRKAGGDFKMVHKLNGGSLGWILNVEWLRSLRKRREVLKSCAKLNGESLGWIFNVGTGGDFKIVHKLNGGSLGGWYSLLPATNFCSEWSVDRDQYWEGGAPLLLVLHTIA